MRCYQILITNNRTVSYPEALLISIVPVSVGLKVVEVVWGVDLCNIICTDMRMRSVVRCG
jgi:hypothetical protein